MTSARVSEMINAEHKQVGDLASYASSIGGGPVKLITGADV